MSKKSNKKKRQRERKRKELERLRGGSSLVDAATPTPQLLEISPVPDRSLLANHAKPSESSASPQQTSSTPSRPQHEREATDAASASKPSSPSSHSVMDIPLSGPKAPTWRRVDFVFPGNHQPFVFARQQTKKEEAASSDAKEENGKNNHKKDETIEDILFSKKRQKVENPEADSAKQHGVVAQHSKETSKKQEETPLSAPRLRKLESTFERVHRESIDEKTVDASSFVDLPQQHGKKVQLTVSKQEEERVDAQEKGRRQDLVLQKEQLKRPPQQEILTQPVPKRGKLSGRSVEEAVQDKKGLRPRANSTDGELNLPQGGLCDEQMVLEAYRWHHENQRSPRGFHNLGNTCYLNSTLQCLAHVPPFCQTLVAISEKKMKRRRDGNLFKGQRVTSYLSSLFRQAHGLSSSSAPMGGAIAPRNLVGALPLIGSCGSKGGYMFRPGRQEDAHEFLVHLLDTMNDGELRAAGINQHASGWRDGLPVSRLDETTFVHRIFGGYFRSQVCCPKCNYRSNTYDPFLDLSLEISKKSSNSVLQALLQFTRKETLDSENKWKCDGCKKYVCPTKQLTVFRPPLALCIQLKRFAFNGGSPFGMNGYGFKGFPKFHGGGGSKISKPIEFPASLSLPLSDNRSCAYSLTGMVIHVGGSASSGHYTAIVKRPGKKGMPSQWYHIDDDVVELVSEKFVLRQKDVYLLFYSRKEVKIEFPTPPPRSMTAAEATEFGRNRARARADSISKAEPDEKSKPASAAAPVPHKKDVVRIKTHMHPLATQSQLAAPPIDASSSTSSSEPSPSQVQLEKYSCVASKKSNGLAGATNKDSSSDGESSGASSDSQPMTKAAPAAPLRTSAATLKDDSDSSSESESDSDSSSSARAEEKGGGRDGGYFGEPTKTLDEKPKHTDKTRVVVNNSDSRGKVKVMLGPKKRKAWESKATAVPSKEKNYQLLGNMKVSRWDEEESDGEQDGDSAASLPNSKANGERQKIVDSMQKQDSTRKRKMHLDRWDALLDQGRQKKVKSATNRTPETETSANPMKNRFHQIQSGVQRMVRGKPKGHYSNKNGKKNNQQHRSFGFRQGFGKF
jgi:ubiquitin carboxyl-terminal hydrolase 36/42